MPDPRGVGESSRTWNTICGTWRGRCASKASASGGENGHDADDGLPHRCGRVDIEEWLTTAPRGCSPHLGF
jgi:hypothetical protein